MTVQQAIERANDMKQGNACDDELKIVWLNELEHTIHNEVLSQHYPMPSEWVDKTEGDTLYAESPDDVIYIYWLMAKIDLYAQEYDKYNIDLSLFENAYQNYKNGYHSTHKTKELPQIKVGVFR